jgi:hypothetical protein
MRREFEQESGDTLPMLKITHRLVWHQHTAYFVATTAAWVGTGQPSFLSDGEIKDRHLTRPHVLYNACKEAKDRPFDCRSVAKRAITKVMEAIGIGVSNADGGT